MRVRSLHPWNVSPSEARVIQERLKNKLVLKKCLDRCRTVAGADVAFDKEGGRAYASVAVYDFPSLDRIETVSASAPLEFPYVPGLLAFREAPVLLAAFSRLEREPDLIIFDGQGIAHPRRMGIATHLGIVLDKPSIGCAKSRLTGEFTEPGPRAGSSTPLKDGDEVIGAVVRTRDNVRPVFVSPGQKMDVDSSVEVILGCLDGYRLPRPTREADKLVAEAKRTLVCSQNGK